MSSIICLQNPKRWINRWIISDELSAQNIVQFYHQDRLSVYKECWLTRFQNKNKGNSWTLKITHFGNREEMWCHVTMVAKFLDQSNRKLKQQQQWRHRVSGKKAIGLVNKTTMHSFFFFFTFLSHRCMTVTWNVLILCACFMVYVNTTQKFSFFFLNLDMVLSDSTPENFTNIWLKMKLNKINEVWNNVNSLLKRCFLFVVIQNFCYHGNKT